MPLLEPRDSIDGSRPLVKAAAEAAAAAEGSTGFGATVFDLPAELPKRRGPDSPFDVCHVGVVLRALLFVHASMAIGLIFAASSFTLWIGLVAAGASVALPGVLAGCS